MLEPVSRCARFEDQLQLDGESNAKIADHYGTGSSARRNVAVGDLPTSSVSAPQLVLETLGSAPTPPVAGLEWRRLRWVGVKWRTQQLVLLQRNVGEVASVRRVVGDGTVGGVTGALRGSGPHLDRGCNVSIIPGVHDGHLGSVRRLAVTVAELPGLKLAAGVTA